RPPDRPARRHAGAGAYAQPAASQEPQPMRTFPIFLVVLTLLAASAAAQTSYPMITHAAPVAVQRGKTTSVVVSGQMNFAGAYKVLFEGKGVSALVVPPAKPAALTRSVT